MPSEIRTFDTTCWSDLLVGLNALGTLPTCTQIIVLGNGDAEFEFTNALTAGQITIFDNYLAAWVCPVVEGENEDLEIDDDAPADGDTLWSSEKIEEEIQSALQSGFNEETAILQVRDSVGFNNVPLTYTTLFFDNIDVENRADILERDDTNTERLYARETGWYFVSYSFTADDEITIRCMKNGTTEVDGSLRTAGDLADTNQIITINANQFYVFLNADEYIMFEFIAQTTFEILQPGGVVTMSALRGTRGLPGPAGADGADGADGTGLINIENDGTPLTGQYETINFTGGEITASNTGSQQADITIQPIFGSNYQYAESNTVLSTTSGAFIEKVSLTTPNLPAGTYRIGWNYNFNADSNQQDFVGRVQLNDSVTLMEHQQEPKDSAGTFGSTGTNQKYLASGFINQSLSGVNTIDIDFASSDGVITVSIWNARIEIWRVQ